MKPTSSVHKCPTCGGSGVRCTGCGTYYRSAGLGCIGSSCRAAAAAVVCRCGRVHRITA